MHRRGGRAEGLVSCFGTGLGGLLHVFAAALGLSLLIAQSAWAFTLLKYVGAAYLLYLSVRMLRRKGPSMAVAAVTAQGARRALMEGIAVEALNVKTSLFFWPSCRSLSHPMRRWCRNWWCGAPFAWRSTPWSMWSRCLPPNAC